MTLTIRVAVGASFAAMGSRYSPQIVHSTGCVDHYSKCGTGVQAEYATREKFAAGSNRDPCEHVTAFLGMVFFALCRASGTLLTCIPLHAGYDQVIVHGVFVQAFGGRCLRSIS